MLGCVSSITAGGLPLSLTEQPRLQKIVKYLANNNITHENKNWILLWKTNHKTMSVS